MSLKDVIEFVDEPSYGFNTNAIVVQDNEQLPLPQEPPKKRGPGRPPKNSYNNSNVYTDTESVVKVSKSQTPEAQYEKSYAGATKLLLGAIAQSDNIYHNLETELTDLREHPAKGGKVRGQIMSEYMNTQIGAVNSKINAIREIDSIRHKINDLVMKRLQLDKEAMDNNPDKMVMDAYYAMVNAPSYGLPQIQSPLAPTTINTGINMSGQMLRSTNLIGPDIIPANRDPKMNETDRSFEQYKQNLTPVQRKMILNNDPNIKTVVVYDQSTGRKWFDVVDISTGQSIPNVTKPGEFLLDNMRIDARNGIASNSNINQSFPLVIVGDRVADEL